ncbi:MULTISPECIES: ATP-binding protein [unclassified Pseudovibrio]|uniref:ATP-binding protein n=1 Tax=unclassified Pseudovibrio TaxID=2627060 RepID=UPI0007B2998A|nr:MULTISPECIES: ATP-binding protein [unclassified Pseudovibrio]KZK94443.1 hypothetical protein PsW74_04585 [Pseudovibrio sp. W74]KZL07197.1 hypothetical protein PsAD14_04212 [Pseudovibrio sp. Ad14]
MDTSSACGGSFGGVFERGISQYPNIGDAVHLTTEHDLERIYKPAKVGQISIGSLSSAENIPAKISLNELVTRHSAILGSTGSGKSTSVASLLRSIAEGEPYGLYLNARIVLLDIHGEYSKALFDIARVFSVDPRLGEQQLNIPFWALEFSHLMEFLLGGVNDAQEIPFIEKVLELKTASFDREKYAGIARASITVDTPIPFSLAQLWYDLIDEEVKTVTGQARDEPALEAAGNPNDLTLPRYTPHAIGAKGPYINPRARGVRRQLDTLRSRLLDRRYDFLLHPSGWEPSLAGKTERDLDALLAGWLGTDKPITYWIFRQRQVLFLIFWWVLF